MRSLAVAFVVTLAACAQAPADLSAGGAASDSSPPTPVASTPVAQTPVTETPVAQRDETKPADATASSPAPEPEQTSGVPSGYSVVERNGVTMYCSNKPTLGTRVKAKTTCMTKEQYETSRQDARDKMREKQGQRVWQ